MPKFTEKDRDRLMRLKGATRDGSVMNAVMNNNLLDMECSDVYIAIVQALLNDKANLIAENAKLGGILKKHGLYTSEILFE